MDLKNLKDATPIFRRHPTVPLDEFKKGTVTGMEEDPMDVARNIKKISRDDWWTSQQITPYFSRRSAEVTLLYFVNAIRITVCSE